MKVLALIVALCAIAGVRAELGADCQVDSDCDNNEFCIKGMMIKVLQAVLMGGKMPDMAGEMAQEEEPMGKCKPKSRIYEPCIMDNMCETAMCLKGPMPGKAGPPFIGRCVECRSDDDCSGNQYCSHPVINANCIESLIFGLKIKQSESEMKSMAKKRMGGYGKDDDDDMPDMPPAKLRMFLQQLMKMVEENGGPPGGGPPGSPRPFPMFRSNRQKRGLGHFVINAPKMTCMAKKPVNSPCNRSPVCQSDKCTIEGMCAI